MRSWGGVDVQPMKQIFIFIYHFLIVTECEAKFYCFVWCQALQKKLLIMLFWCSSFELKLISKSGWRKCLQTRHCLLLSLFNQTDYELNPSRNVMITIEKPSEFSVKFICVLNVDTCPIHALPFTVGWRSLVTWPNILHVYWTIKVYLKWLLKLKH